jgi:hypothetical protein
MLPRLQRMIDTAVGSTPRAWGWFILTVMCLITREGGASWFEPVEPQYVASVRGTGVVISCPLLWPSGFK